MKRGAQSIEYLACYTVRQPALAVLCLGLLLLGGCASQLQATRLMSAPPPRFGQAVELTQVPFFPQERYQCGPAALATVLTWSGVNVTPEQLTSRVYLPKRRGSLQVELAAAARGYHRIPYVLAPEFEALLDEVRAGHPVLVLLNLGLSWYPVWHYAVVVGFDLGRDHIVMRSGTTRRDVVSMELFERTWRRSKRWAMVVTTPDQLPVTAQQLPFLRTVLAFEQAADWRVAGQAYAAAWRQWPDSEGAGMGVGNSAFAEGDYVSAATTYRRLLALHPGFAPAMNNLALSLAKQGDWSAGERYARAAVAAGGAHRQAYQETLQQIRDHIAQ